MDISAILPVNMGSSESSSSLNDDFSATTPAGENIFNKPLGARTVFQTPNKGAIIVSFFFDPKQKYQDHHIMASVTTDYIAELREGLIRHLLEEKDIVPKNKTLEETVWEQLTAVLPKEVMSKQLFTAPGIFDNYKELITANVTKNYKEEEILTEKIRDTEFSYSLEIAIDAYPGDLTKENKKKGDTTGVLTFHIRGIPDGQVPQPAKDEEKDEKAEATKTKKRKAEGEASANSASKKTEREKLLADLALIFPETTKVDNQKQFPHSASLFFESVNRWFSSVVSRRSAKLEKDRNRNPLYH